MFRSGGERNRTVARCLTRPAEPTNSARIDGYPLQRMSHFMNATDRKDPPVSRVYSSAIWNEIGERLRSTSMGRPSPISPQLLRLVRELDRLDVSDAPSRLN